MNAFEGFDSVLLGLDKVQVKEKDFDILTDFCEKVPEETVVKYLKGELKFPFEQASFSIVGYDKIIYAFYNSMFTVTVKFAECMLMLSVFVEKGKIQGGIVRICWHDGTFEDDISIIEEFYNSLEENIKSLIINIQTITLQMMLFISEYNETEFIERKENKQTKSKNHKKRKSPENKNHVVKIKKKVYKMPDKRETRERIVSELKKKPVVRHIESWTVRGHWRTLKTGKEVWVKPHIKGKGELTPKIYKI